MYMLLLFLIVFVDKNIQKNLFESLIFDWTVSDIDLKKLSKVFVSVIGSIMYISSFPINDGVSLFFVSLTLEIYYLSKFFH